MEVFAFPDLPDNPKGKEKKDNIKRRRYLWM